MDSEVGVGITINLNFELKSTKLFFRCDVCGYQSYCPSALKKHMVSHEAPKFGCREAIQCHFGRWAILKHI